MAESTTWYTDDITLYSASSLWRTSRRQGIIAGSLICLFFLFRKAIGWRFRPTYGTTLPDRLPIIPSEQIPPDVRDATATALATCRDADMTVCFSTKPPYIGGRSGYSVVMLDRAGTTYATAIWLRTTVGLSTAENTMLSCHSLTSSGTELHTGGVDPSVDMRLIMPGNDLLALPLDTPPESVIAAHRERIVSRTDLVRFDSDSLSDHVMTAARRYLDWRIEQGYLVPLTPAEVHRLGGEQA
ncbi:MAG: hypothetical protein WBC44_10240 [Planctomycetaceae bacterium]